MVRPIFYRVAPCSSRGFYGYTLGLPRCLAGTRARRVCPGLIRGRQGLAEDPGADLRLHNSLLTEFLDFVFAVTHHLTQDRCGMLAEQRRRRDLHRRV
jgi:hypothetical protein